MPQNLSTTLTGGGTRGSQEDGAACTRRRLKWHSRRGGVVSRLVSPPPPAAGLHDEPACRSSGPMSVSKDQKKKKDGDKGAPSVLAAAPRGDIARLPLARDPRECWEPASEAVEGGGHRDRAGCSAGDHAVVGSQTMLAARGWTEASGGSTANRPPCLAGGIKSAMTHVWASLK